jgi:hypothetical protein
VRKLGIALLFALGCALVFVAIFWLPSDPNNRVRTDDQMIAMFGGERASFDSLATMLDRDRWIRDMSEYGELLDMGQGVVYRHSAHREVPGITDERWNAYERLLRRVRVGNHVWPDSFGIAFEQYAGGGWRRGYYWGRRPLAIVRQVREGDLLTEKSTYGLPLYRHLDGRWYIFSAEGSGD